MSRARSLAVALVGLAVAALLGAPSAAADPPAPPGTPTASSFAGVPTVGPLFRHGLAADHECTASVIASPARDLILTAAHCVTGTATGYLFAPGYRAGATPLGVWTVVAAYLDPSWIRSQDPDHDFAVLQVSSHGPIRLQDVTGGNLLGPAPSTGTQITDIAYNAGSGDLPVRCSTVTYVTNGYPSFNCHGYVGGSSGSPWLTPLRGTRIAVVRGVIGGLHQGGCYEYTSYTSPIEVDVLRLFARAVLSRHPDTAPTPGSDGC